MTAVVWSAEAEIELLQLPVGGARALLDALDELASEGRGFVRDMLDERGTRALYVPDYVAFFRLDAAENIHVLRVRQMRVETRP